MERTGAGMQEPPLAILFDLDNTLVDLVHAKMEACRAIVREAGQGDPDDLFSYFLREDHSFEDPRNILDFLADQGIRSRETGEICVSIYEEVKLRCTRTYPGVPELLEACNGRGIALAIVTDANRRNAANRLEKAGISRFFDCLVTPESTGTWKPSPEPFLHALREVGIRPVRGLAVGDSPRRDIAPARAVGLTTVYAAYGDRFAGTRAEDIPAHYTIRRPRDLLDLIPYPTGGTR
ncbi:MAG: HAD family hydrolase [Methanomicrobiales archaeon]|nr:HAD family hydrolase [Methanomicrobiales archaeon]